jgi:hypothetical protein
VAEILVGRGRRTPTPPPPPSRKIDEFSEILTKRGLKTVFSREVGGGGVVGNLKVLSEI